MKLYDHSKVNLLSGYMYDKQELNRKITINSVYDRFFETGRIPAFDFSWKEGEPNKPHFFWDSDVAKWVEGASYIIEKFPDAELEKKIEWLVDRIEEHQDDDGYFNIYFTVVEPENRFKNRFWHELYCAGHLFEAAVAYAKATGRDRFLKCMEKYADYIYDVFVTKDSATFSTPGHEEIELALVKMYRYTGKKKYLDLAAHFVNQRGCSQKDDIREYHQTHVPVREQTEALGHSVRAVYLYTAMADLAYELKDKELEKACKTLYGDLVNKKMYITGGLGSTSVGEAFTKPYDLPNEEAYTETCASIGLMFFCSRMQLLDNSSTYADTIERAFYNGVMSGLSVDGTGFFYENPLEITMLNHFSNMFGTKRYPITQRVECFDCSCCPPNINRLLSSLGAYIYGIDGDTLYINQFASSTLDDEQVKCKMTTEYPSKGVVCVKAEGTDKVAVRIPSWCEKFTANKKYSMDNGYAVFDSQGEIIVEFDMTPFAICAKTDVVKDVGKLCVQAGPVVYCAEKIDNGENLHALSIDTEFGYAVSFDSKTGLNNLEIDGYRYENTTDKLYARAKNESPVKKAVKIKLIPYSTFANRGETDMLVWFNRA